MAGLIPDQVLEDILSKIDIVEVIGSYIPLKRAGRNLKACCPFHHEKTPSFIVSPDKQIYNCFGCGESGNAFKFLMRYEGMDFPEAAEVLAQKAGVRIDKSISAESKSQSMATQIFKANELASKFYQASLESPENSKAKEYLLKRGIAPQTLNLLCIGFAPDKWDALINHLRAKGISLAILEKAGLILSRDGSGYYDRFRNRIMFPIFDIKGRVLGFGARVLDGSTPKYINSPETPVYIKGRNLYGLNFVKNDIREKDYVAVVEGYMDFLLPYQEGFKNIVASQGTALTCEQVRLIKRYTGNAVIIYDGDTAGELASLRSLDIFIDEEVNLKVVTLPKGFDPDSFVRKNGINAFRDEVEKAPGIFDYKLKLLKSRYDIKDANNKTKVSMMMLETIARFKNEIIKSEYLKKLSFELSVKEEALLEELKKIKITGSGVPKIEPLVVKNKSYLKTSPTEKLLVSLFIEENSLINRIRDNFDPQDFADKKMGSIVSKMLDLVREGKEVRPQVLTSHLGDDLCELMGSFDFLQQDLTLEHKEKMVDDCLKRMKKERKKIRREQLHEEIRIAQHAGDEVRLNKLIEEFNCLIKEG